MAATSRDEPGPGGLVLLAELPEEELAALYAPERYIDRPDERPDLVDLPCAPVFTVGARLRNRA